MTKPVEKDRAEKTKDPLDALDVHLPAGETTTRGDVYSALPELAGTAEQVSWNRLYNMLMGNSILVLAWATVYVNVPAHNRAPAKAVLFAISIMGMLMSLPFAVLARRGRRALNAYVRMGRRIEDGQPWKTPEDNAGKKLFDEARGPFGMIRYYSPTTGIDCHRLGSMREA